MHPLDARTDRKEMAQAEQGLGYCNITKCCTEVCPEHIKITDNAIIPMKERVIDRRYDPVVRLGRRIFRRDQVEGGVATQDVGSVEVAGEAPYVPAGISWHAPEPRPVVASIQPGERLSATEFTLDRSGAASPFGDDVEFPLPVESLRYQRPSTANPDYPLDH